MATSPTGLLYGLGNVPGLVLGPRRYHGEYYEGQDNGGDNQSVRDWHNYLRFFMMAYENELALTWIKCDARDLQTIAR